MKLYGLFLYTYDYHEWEDLEHTSYCRGKLEGSIGLRGAYAETEEQHEDYAEVEKSHYYIKEVKVI